MQKFKKYLLIFITVAVIAAIGVWYYVFIYSKNNHRNVANEKGIEVTAMQLVSEYKASDSIANKKYLDKAIQVTGEVAEAKTNEDSTIAVTLKSADAFSNVYCTLLKNQTQPLAGKVITLKGICTGMLSDVVLIDAVIVKQ